MIDVTDTAFDELMRTLVLDPAGMSDSSFSQQFPRQRPGLVALGDHVTGTPAPRGSRALPEMAGEGPCRCPQFGQAGVYAGYPAVPGGPVEPRSRRWGGWTVRRR
jgi:hypothetical protein